MRNHVVSFRGSSLIIGFALIVALVLPLSVQAQDAAYQVFLPMATTGNSTVIAIPGSGPSGEPEVTAAGSCYWSGSGRGSVTVWRDQTITIAKSTTRNCRDINIHSSHCGVGVDYHVKENGQRGYVWITAGHWQTVVRNLPDGWHYELKVSAWDSSNRNTTIHYAG